jgi:hypothetical protein
MFTDIVHKHGNSQGHNHNHNFKIFLTRGKSGQAHTWYYVKVNKLKLPLYSHALQSGNMNVSDFGEVLFSGWGKNPPDSVRRKIDEMYG